jgi:hypothetical protein
MRFKNLAVAATLALGLATLALVMFSVPASPISAQAGEGVSHQSPAGGESSILRDAAALGGIQAPDPGSNRRTPAGTAPASDGLSGLQKEGLPLDRGPLQSGFPSVTADAILDGSFESGPDGPWTEFSKQGWPLILNEEVLLAPPRSGAWAAWLGGDDDEVSVVYQLVGIPTENAILGYWVWIASQDPCGSPYDVGGVILGTEPEPTIVDIFELCDLASTDRWVKREVDLSAYAGQLLVLDIRAETSPESEHNSNLFVDDVTLGTSQPGQNRIMLPAVLRGVGGGPEPFAPPCSASNDCEDYDTWGTAYGPLRPGEEYWAHPNDNNDYYYFRTDHTSSPTVRVTSYNATGQVLVRRQDLSEVAKDFNVPPGADGVMEVPLPNLPAGKYYVQVFTSGGQQQSSRYNLKVQ